MNCLVMCTALTPTGTLYFPISTRRILKFLLPVHPVRSKASFVVPSFWKVSQYQTPSPLSIRWKIVCLYALLLYRLLPFHGCGGGLIVHPVLWPQSLIHASGRYFGDPA